MYSDYTLSKLRDIDPRLKHYKFLSADTITTNIMTIFRIVTDENTVKLHECFMKFDRIVSIKGQMFPLKKGVVCLMKE